MSDHPKENFPVVGYIKDRKKVLGYAYLTKKGNLCIKADELIDPSQLGRLVKKGIYVEGPQNNLSQIGYTCAADDYDNTFNIQAVPVAGRKFTR